MEEGRDRRRLKLSTLTVMGRANIYVLITDWLNEMNWQSMERSRTWESKHWKPCLRMMNFEVGLAGCSSRCCVFSVPRSLAMFLCYAPLVMLFWILSSTSFVFSGKRGVE
ncbi:PREDICTED: uncharacterized protein LOC105116420 [Populus euphratica]|uniref:Uncharacterized protein LOC105116420 n=1 Tax=Populus euphratica TaxID=75702 RepID=A0AAJ6XB55_POPEU|nr:PREDICTED: uncharacterized protein LOC105116420 [Populus euphratica]